MSRVKRIVKWPGGKESELDCIKASLPSTFNRLYDPFVGGGSVFLGIDAERYFINDMSTELMSLYRSIARQDKEFMRSVRDISNSWSSMLDYALCSPEYECLYASYAVGGLSDDQLKDRADKLVSSDMLPLSNCLCGSLRTAGSAGLASRLSTTLSSRMRRMKSLGVEDPDAHDCMSTAVMGALYSYLRDLYNDTGEGSPLHCALFLFVRNYSYGGMFRYSSSGKFNVPYGGAGYNRKSLDGILESYSSEELQERLGRTEMRCMDFEEFLRECPPSADDLVFIDPPYDSRFSSYAGNSFTQDDQERLASYLKNDCKARWMAVVKDTPLIRSLYSGGTFISSYDKSYRANFRNRNDRAVTHLLITNYPH